MLGEIADKLFIVVIMLIFLYIIYRLNKWLIKKEGVLTVIYKFLKKPGKE